MQILGRRCRYIPNRDINWFATQPTNNVIVKIPFEEYQIASTNMRRVKTREGLPKHVINVSPKLLVNSSKSLTFYGQET